MENITRLEILLSEKELQLAIEGRYTNLRIWYSTHNLTKNEIFFRLDCYKQYSTPIAHGIDYLHKEHEALTTLMKEYEFAQMVTIADLNRIIEITIGMKQRKVLPW